VTSKWKWHIRISYGALFDLYVGVCEASDKYADQLEDMLVHSTGKKVAGFIAETIQVYSTHIVIMISYHHYHR